MTSVLVLGAGKIGAVVADMLASSDDYAVTLADRRLPRIRLKAGKRVRRAAVDVVSGPALRRAVGACEVVVSALPFFLNPRVATARLARALARGAKTAFVPQCGLAPRFVSIAARRLVETFDELRDVRLRVGALPQFPDNGLRYNLTWSTDRLINEYCNSCEAIHEGEAGQLLACSGSPSTASTTRRSRRRAASALSARRWRAGSATSTTRPSATPATAT